MSNLHQQARPHQLVGLTAETTVALETTIAELHQYLRDNTDVNMTNVAYTLQAGPQRFAYRCALVCKGHDDALATLDAGNIIKQTGHSTQPRPVTFMFPGVGDHYVHMGQALYDTEPVFQRTVDHCCQLLQPILGLDLRQILYPAEAMPETPTGAIDLAQMLGRKPAHTAVAVQPLHRAEIAQPLVFMIEYALAQLLQAWGIMPDALIGYSLGEYVAATVAGVLSLADALKLVAKRAQLIQRLPEGGMLAVSLSEAAIQPLLEEPLSLAIVSDPTTCVLAGPPPALARLQETLIHQKIICRRLETTHALHTPLMAPITTEFMALLQTVQFNAPQIPYLSNVTGHWITAEEATDPHYWQRHLCQTVRFESNLAELLCNQEQILLEVGPGNALISFARQHPDCSPAQLELMFPTLRYTYVQEPDDAFLLETVGKLWLVGNQPDWESFYSQERCQQISLPFAPFATPNQARPDEPEMQPQFHNKPDGENWFYIPSWQQSPLPSQPVTSPLPQTCWLLFIDTDGLGDQLSEQLQQAGQAVIKVQVGSAFSGVSDQVYTLNPQHSHDYEALLDELDARGQKVQAIVHLWTVTANNDQALNVGLIDQTQERGLNSSLFLVQALAKRKNSDKHHLTIISNHVQPVTERAGLHPEKAPLLGAVKVIPQEHPNVICRLIDVGSPQSAEKLIGQIMVEIMQKLPEQVVAYRQNQRWLPTLKPVKLGSTQAENGRLRENGVYLIAGGLGDIGLILAEYLAQTQQAKLILLDQAPFPTRDEWPQWLSSNHKDVPIRRQIQMVQKLETLGAEVLIVSTDMTNRPKMQASVTQAEAQFGPIEGIIFAVDDAPAKLIQQHTAETIQQMLSLKMKAALCLHDLFHHKSLDFFIFFSSLIAFKGEFGQVGACAANAFLDAFAHHTFTQSTSWTLSINWDRWWTPKVAATTSLPPALRKLYENYLELAISPQEGVQAFKRILSAEIAPQIVVTAEDLKEEHAR